MAGMIFIQMAPTRLPNSFFLYALKVWLTTLVLGPMLWLLFVRKDGIRGGYLDVYVYVFYLGIAFSFPCFLLFWLGVRQVERQSWGLPCKKLAACVVAETLAVLLFVAVMLYLRAIPNRYTLPFMLGYLSALLAAVFVYRWPAKGAVRSAEEKK
jgi:hypothetical protein